MEITLELINSILKLEFSTNNDSGNFTTCRVNISNKLHLYLNSPMTFYNADTTDLFLFVLGNVFDINIFILKLNERECWVEDLMKNHGCDRETIHFVKTMSQHIDLVAPIPTAPMARYNKLNHTGLISIAGTQIKTMILVLNVSCFRVFFLKYKITCLKFIFIVNSGRNQR